MLISSRLANTVRNQLKVVFKRGFSTTQPENNQTTENDDLPFQYNPDWKEQTQKVIKEQVDVLESELSEQQKKRVRVLADALLELNNYEMQYYHALRDYRARKLVEASPIKKTEAEIKYEEQMSKLWPMGQTNVAQIFSALFSNPVGGFGGSVGGGGAQPEEAEQKEEGKGAAAQEKTSFEVQLTSIDAAQKIKIIKEVRELLKLGLKEAKETVEKVPVTLLKDVKKEEADALKEKLEAAGCVITLL